MGALAAAALGALVLAGGPDRFATRVWNDSDGLPQNSVLAIHQSRDGLLWLGTQDGVAQFDGKSFDPLLAAARGVTSVRYARGLLEDHAGTHWIGTGDGTVLRRRGGPEAEVTEIQLGLEHSAVTAMAEASSGEIWVATTKGLASLRDGTVHHWAPP